MYSSSNSQEEHGKKLAAKAAAARISKNWDEYKSYMLLLESWVGDYDEAWAMVEELLNAAGA